MHLLSGTAEGDSSGVGQSGGGAALQHLLSGHSADHPHPAGYHTAQPAHRLRPLAQPGRPTWKSARQVRGADVNGGHVFLVSGVNSTLLVTPQVVRLVRTQLLLHSPQRLVLSASTQKTARRY